MTEYRAYSIGHDGKINGVEPFDCAGDAEAIEEAKCRFEGQSIELWNGARLVVRHPGELKEKAASVGGLLQPTIPFFERRSGFPRGP